jgi:hypothetical protein
MDQKRWPLVGQFRRPLTGIQSKRLKAGWDERYLATLLFEAPKISPQKTASKGSNIRKT